MPEPPETSNDRDDGEADSRRAALVGLIVIALLVVAALYLVQALHHKSQLEDCLMAGRRNCAPIETPPRGQ
jgi:hypothetical protein